MWVRISVKSTAVKPIIGSITILFHRFTNKLFNNNIILFTVSLIITSSLLYTFNHAVEFIFLYHFYKIKIIYIINFSLFNFFLSFRFFFFFNDTLFYVPFVTCVPSCPLAPYIRLRVCTTCSPIGSNRVKLPLSITDPTGIAGETRQNE